MKTVIIDSHYFPCIEYLSFIDGQDKVLIESKEYFVKQTYRNRCYIMTTHGVQPLSVPVKNGNKKVPMDEIEIDYKEKWLNTHWRAIISAYNKSPYFEYYKDILHDILFVKHDRLLDLNKEILSFCLKSVNIDTEICYTNSYVLSNEDDLKDMRSVIHPKKEHFQRNIFHPKTYMQIFGNIFVPNLSVLDLVSCNGPTSNTYL
ncbi:WbqC family protein [Reichenbachiella versicolor]|uniref:WbqC family protein n=1 Tax=Reichenbachiella versicolor TaxID=1821036 RepID=UPI000D6E1B2D|nr:WbqC family protein [Reichenbachiella versicolor]